MARHCKCLPDGHNLPLITKYLILNTSVLKTGELANLAGKPLTEGVPSSIIGKIHRQT